MANGNGKWVPVQPLLFYCIPQPLHVLEFITKKAAGGQNQEPGTTGLLGSSASVPGTDGVCHQPGLLKRCPAGLQAKCNSSHCMRQLAGHFDFAPLRRDPSGEGTQNPGSQEARKPKSAYLNEKLTCLHATIPTRLGHENCLNVPADE